MGFDVSVGLFLCVDDADAAHWPTAERERWLAELNTALRALGLPEHREPRSPADVEPPWEPASDPCHLGASLGSYSSHGRRVERLDWLARHVAVLGTAPATDPPYEAGVYQAYDDLPDRSRTFDHLLAACGHDAVILPRHLDEVLWAPGTTEAMWLVSASRIRIEAAALGHVLRYPGETGSPGTDPITGEPIAGDHFDHLTGHVADDAESWQPWAEVHQLCHRLLAAAHDVLRTGALGLTG
ncbi:hypothetical protein LX16_4903 [Stackebrandtia albiflava]|uniref:Uncharacterized protein n=1 Tax=Stackebrandtia albiflava TaxID=406432 RepID=A0A562UQ44_9ACTN|nr:hypothetical protein [Stackebrandtia albiflava]TWJ07742.1 hypothetical protein LX16_4903 [Stackebrandtia albiflava]